MPPGKQLLKTAQLAHYPSSDSRKTTLPDRPWIFAPEPTVASCKAGTAFKSANV
jgi:hypothetical protein